MLRTTSPGKLQSAWGKVNAKTGESHHLAHHSADVAAVFLELARHAVWRSRIDAAAGRPLTTDEIECIAALIFLHDIGKLAPGFQAKGWLDESGSRIIGHLEAGWRWKNLPRPDALAGAISYLARWPDMHEWFAVLMAHHGRPVPDPLSGNSAAVFHTLSFYDWRHEEAILGHCLLNWFPAVVRASVPPPKPQLLHLLCGLLTLADWVASDRRAFGFEPELRSDYWLTAQVKARSRLADIGLARSPPLRSPAGWHLISDHSRPRPAQSAVGALLASEHLILLEAETGAGKTEAALWRFASLLDAGEVDALYFAVLLISTEK
jgi:CRISPR-associated endonuclease/helicase Cas3